jgi:putative nucleotidyltransferase with HDIG domain
LDAAIRPDAGVADAGAGDALPVRIWQERIRELEALIRGCFRLLIPFYEVGVIGNSEFPNEKKKIRVFSRGQYVVQTVSKLHRFSELRPALEKSATQFFFKTDPEVRQQVINYILQRLPPNLSYAKENEKFIKDISQVTGVKVVLIRTGDILVRKGQTIDTRAYYAIRASIAASTGVSQAGRNAGKLGLLVALMLLLVMGTREICGPAFNNPRTYLLVFTGLMLITIGGQLIMFYLPIHQVVIPQAALALVFAVVLGRAPGLIIGLAVPCTVILTQAFDLSTWLVGAAGGLTGALTVRRRRRSSALVAGVLVGVVQSVVFEASRMAEGRPQTYEELWSAGVAFSSGLLSGTVALLSLPFVEWLLGKSSRGKLKVLTDFDHPLVRELRERAPGTFAHTVTLINMVELAADAVGGDRLLSRAGTLFHDIGKMESSGHFIENQGQGPNIHDELPPAKSAEVIRGHVTEGIRIAKRHHLPLDVAAFIPEHHGTTRIDFFLNKAEKAGEQPDPELFRYPGPKPQSIETAILMLADSVEAASKTLAEPTEAALDQLVDRIVLKKVAEEQFDECDLTQADLKRIKAAFVAYLKGALHRRVKYPDSEDTGPAGD